MGRLVLVICAVALMCDLAADGGLGRVKCVAPQHAGHYSLAASQANSPQVDSPVGLPPANLRDLPCPWAGQPAPLGVVHFFTLNAFYFFGSSGGLPL